MRRCESCGCPLPADSAPQRRYCDPTEHPDCKRERDAFRKAHERARAFNAYTCVTLESPEPVRRRTSSSRDEEGELDWDSLSAGGGMWQAIRQAWFPLDGNPPMRWRVLPASHGPEATDQCSEVDRLMEKAEGRTRPRVGQLRDSGWVDTEDWGSAGELWLRGEVERAESKARNEVWLARRRAR
jgi:hypothetical protein